MVRPGAAARVYAAWARWAAAAGRRPPRARCPTSSRAGPESRTDPRAQGRKVAWTLARRAGKSHGPSRAGPETRTDRRAQGRKLARTSHVGTVANPAQRAPPRRMAGRRPCSDPAQPRRAPPGRRRCASQNQASAPRVRGRACSSSRPARTRSASRSFSRSRSSFCARAARVEPYPILSRPLSQSRVPPHLSLDALCRWRVRAPCQATQACCARAPGRVTESIGPWPGCRYRAG